MPLQAARQPAPGVEIATFYANPARNNTFDEPGPAGDPVVVWTANLGLDPVPQQVVIAGGITFCGTGEGIIAIDQATGMRRWTFDGVIGAADQWGVSAGVGYINGLIVSGSEIGVLYALDAESGEKRWELHDVAEMAQPAFGEGLLFVPGNRNVLFAIEAATGNEVWRIDLADVPFRWSCYADGRVFVATWDGAMHAYTSRDGAWIWSFTPNPLHTSNIPTVANGFLYTFVFDPDDDTAETVHALNVANGEEVWRTDPMPWAGYLAVSETMVYRAESDGILQAFDAFTGIERWHFDAGEALGWCPFVVGDTVYIESSDLLLFAIDALDGIPRWTLPIDGMITWGIDVADRKLFFATWAGTLWVIGGSESGATPIATPAGEPVLIDADATPGPILSPGFDPATVEVPWISPADAGLGETPTGMTTDRQGMLYVVDASANDIKVFDPDGIFIEIWANPASPFRFGDDERALGGIAFNDAGLAYVSDSLNDRILVFDADRVLVAEIGTVDGPGRVRRPVAIVDPINQRLLVADSGNGRIVLFGLDGTYLDQWGSPGDRNGQFHAPRSMAVSWDGSVYIADPEAQRIQQFTPGGVYLGDVGTPDLLGSVTSIAINRGGFLFASSSSAGAILVFGPDGTFYGSISAISGGESLGSPHDLYLDARGDLCVSTSNDAGGSVMKLRFPPPLILEE